MKRTASLKLHPAAEQAMILLVPSAAPSEACRAMVPFSRGHRCRNRVALHHLAYSAIRERFLAPGRQMFFQPSIVLPAPVRHSGPTISAGTTLFRRFLFIARPSSGRRAATRQPIGPAKAAVTQPVFAYYGLRAEVESPDL